MDTVLSTLHERLGKLFGNRPVVLAGGTRLSKRVAELHQLGARRSLVLTTDDHAPLHDSEVARWVPLGFTGGLTASEQRRLTRVLVDPDRRTRDLLDDFDPAGEALVISTPYVETPEFAGRPILNHRRPAWVALENKTTVDALWDDLSARRAPAVVAGVDEAELWRATEMLDRGAGVVWSGDGPSINGGANFVRRVRSREEADAAFAVLAPKCDFIRVMPFLEGIPVSVHGVVFPDGTAVLRPVEMVVPRRAGAARFLYAGCASYYDPPARIRDEMRNLARRVGEELRGSVGYRGVFTLDGIATEDGFLPTEINTRYGGAMVLFEDALPTLPISLVQAALVAGHDVGVSSLDFEALVLSASDEFRSTSVGANVRAVRQTETWERGVVFTEWSCRWAHPDEVAHGLLRLRPAPLGGRLELELDRTVVPPGRAVVPLTVSAFALADQDWGTGLGPLEPAVPVAEHTRSVDEVAVTA
ncbi:ATP-grasp domain-containing protein [Umezawaea beigongshangensis]|uniref:ATP-grasp domain-containing protein n=1 Tax=Umezawaea beigongshangensis TaxID=2780383 RepID=UPI0018F10BA8|nr:ATP-grasp domain-containing protein [Umezawaea beigongshangensis]